MFCCEKAEVLFSLLLVIISASDGSLTLPLLVDAEQQTIISSAFQAAHMCLKLGGSLPEVVDSHDLVIFKQELDNLGLSQDTACYLGISRWDDYIRGIDNGTLYKDPETGLEIPLNDGEYWYPNTPTHPNRGQYNLFYNSQSNSGSRLISPEDPENPPVTSTLVCSTNAPERLCYFPPWIPGTVRTSSDYPYPPLANAFYWCPTGHVMSIRGQDMEREHKAVCLGNIGWSILPEYYHNATCKLTGQTNHEEAYFTQAQLNQTKFDTKTFLKSVRSDSALHCAISCTRDVFCGAFSFGYNNLDSSPTCYLYTVQPKSYPDNSDSRVWTWNERN